ncbi:MAG: ECF-type sigma factor [Pseudomonadota bacterium]
MTPNGSVVHFFDAPGIRSSVVSMEESNMSLSVTVLLRSHRDGDSQALNQLADLIYPELKALARNRSRHSRTGATTLVNETFVKLLSGGALTTEDKREFFALAATIMRQIIVDEVRYIVAGKRSGQDVTLAETIIGDDGHEQAEFLLQVNDLMGILEKENERHARVFECRYFAGFTTAETAEVLDLSVRSVERAWSEARSRIAELIENDNA